MEVVNNDELILKYLKENNKLLHEVIDILYSARSGDTRLFDTSIQFGVGIISNLIGDEILKRTGRRERTENT